MIKCENCSRNSYQVLSEKTDHLSLGAGVVVTTGRPFRDKQGCTKQELLERENDLGVAEASNASCPVSPKEGQVFL